MYLLASLRNLRRFSLECIYNEGKRWLTSSYLLVRVAGPLHTAYDDIVKAKLRCLTAGSLLEQRER